jgi:4a-hydroxytetrahydrobiopterin dehydratase
MTKLAHKKCLPCQGGVPPLSDHEKKTLLQELDNWSLVDNHHLHREFTLKNYAEALQLANLLSEVAEEENHHPVIRFTWGKLEVDIWTHKIDDLVEADYILAAKFDQIWIEFQQGPV